MTTLTDTAHATGNPPAGEPAPPKQSLRALAIRGTVWTLGGHGAAVLLRLSGNMILTRLLFPRAFGVMAIVNVFLVGLHMFSDIGIGPSIIQNKRGEERDFRNTAWTIQAIRGVMLFVVACMLAWPVARLYGEPDLTWYIPVAASSALVAGLASVSLHTLNRRLALGRLTMIELGSQVSMLVVMITWAYLARTVWALVIGGVISELVRTILSHFLEPGQRPRFRWEPEAARELMTFGRAVFMSTILLFLANQGERMILGHYVSLETLGVYSIAFFMARMGTTLAQMVLQKVLFPVLAKDFRESSDRVIWRYRKARKAIDVMALVSAAGLIALGPFVIRHLYDPRYHAAAWMLQVLAMQSAWDIMRAPASWLLLAAGKPVYSIWANATRLVGLAGGLPLVFFLTGGDTERAVHIAIWVVAISAAPAAIVYSYGVGREFPKLARTEWLTGLALCAALPVLVWVFY